MAIVEKVTFIDRRTGKAKEEQIYFESALRFFYGSALGKIAAYPLAKVSFFSKFSGWWQRLPHSKKKILPFIKKYGLDASEFEQKIDQFRSFDAFFTRKLKKEARPLALEAIIPADGRYLFYQNITSCDGFIVKGEKFSIEKLLADAALSKNYSEASMLIARLAPVDYHRFHFPVNCVPGPARLINGPLFSVNPIAVKQNIELLTENKRMVTTLKTEGYGNILFIEIGATNVGSIHQTYTAGTPYKKGDEKGFFSFGGSSIILLFEKGRIQFAHDLIENSSKHLETFCLFGQSLEKLI